MEKTLIILTSGYPYGIYDDFLHNELQFIKKEFKNIHFVVPFEASKYKIRNLSFTYKVSKIKKKNKLLFLIRNPKSIYLAFKDIRKSKITLSLKALKIALDFQLNSYSYFKIIESDIKKDKLIYVYSYWLDFRSHAIQLLKSRNPFIRTFSRAHGYDIYKERLELNYQPFKTEVKFIDQIYTISNIGKKYLVENYQINSNKIQVSKLGVFQNERFEFEENKIKILTCSNIVPLKRLDLIIEGLSLVKNIDIEWSHVGDGQLKKTLKKLAHEKLSSNIKFQFLGELENNLVSEFYKSFRPNLFINVSSSEGIPVSIMEAMSFGVPCIATNVGGNSEIVSNDNGYLLSENPTPKEIASIINTFYLLPIEEKNKKSENAYQTWKEKYNAEKNYTAFIQQLLSL